MVIHLKNAAIADSAMVGSGWFGRNALLAHANGLTRNVPLQLHHMTYQSQNVFLARKIQVRILQEIEIRNIEELPLHHLVWIL